MTREDAGARAAAAFAERFGRDPEGVWAAPGRVNVIGEHTDYNGGLALPIALPQRTYAAVRPREDGRLRFASTSTSTGVVEVALDDGAAVSAPVVAGAHSIYLRVSGGGSALSVSAPGLCVGDGVVGIPGPR